MTEYLAENSRLRQLSRRYAENQLPFEEYRQARRDIIDALEAGQSQPAALPPLDAPEPMAAASDRTGIRLPDDSAVFYKTMPPRVTAAADADAPEAAPVETPPSNPVSFDGDARVLAIVLGAALLIALMALVYVFIL